MARWRTIEQAEPADNWEVLAQTTDALNAHTFQLAKAKLERKAQKNNTTPKAQKPGFTESLWWPF